MAAIVASAVFAAAAVFAWELSHPDAVPKPPPVADEPVDLAAELGPGWTELPAPPEVRSGAATVWTGSRLITWGGFVFGGGGDKPSTDDGFVFDAATQDWSPLPPSPLVGRSLPASAWTGREFLVWGGTDLNTYPYEGFVDGAAFDPVTGRWRSLPPAPIDGRAPMSVWTGEELIVWGTAVRVTPRPRDGAAYDPATNMWRRIADSPIELTDGTAVWTGEEMIVFGAALHGGNESETETAIGAAYDPAQDTWRELPPSELSPQASTAAWTGREMIAWDYLNGTAAYDPVADRWRALPRVPIDDYECIPQSVSIPGQAMFGNYCGITPVFSVAKDRWRDVTREDLSEWVLEPAAAGSAVLVLGHSLELSEEPNVTFDTRMLAWVPSDASETGGVEDPVPFVPPTEVVGDETRMPVVFPDGTQATVVYPTPLELASLGVQPEVSYLWKDDPPPRFPIVFLHGSDASIADYVDGTEPVGTVNSYRSVEIWRMSEAWSKRRVLLQGHWLRFGLSSWTVLVAIERSDQAEDVAESIEIHETQAGFPVVDTSDPIALSHESGEGEGPMLHIGSVGDRAVLLWIEGCSWRSGVDEVLDSGAYGSACLADGRVTAEIYGQPAAVEAIVVGLRVEDFRQPTNERVESRPFIPEHTVIGDETRIPLVWPDGTTASLAIPSDLGLLEGADVQPSVAYLLKADPPPRFSITFLHGPRGPERSFLLGDEPLRFVQDADGREVELWASEVSPHVPARDERLLFRTRSWTILVPVARALTAEEVARSISVGERAGYPVVRTSGPIALSNEFGEGEGSLISIFRPGQPFTYVQIAPAPCEDVREVGSVYGATCLADGRAFMDVEGAAGLVRTLVEEARIEDFLPVS